ncbi:MAG: hypothetical protein K6G33_13595 [Ruminococcus sp.]|uniref:hypothetical protein n=1 Tax=Ruminococcus sp. TaxID=41978 RepID=UPI0025FBC803|nr:hypothetical protein [Ruminococcus sp.]MCR5601760.1 hypothetical protein [Ruminococcus sp.]
MEIIFEIILELFLEITGKGIYEASKSSRLPKPLRLILKAMILLFFAAFIGMFFLIAFLMFRNDNVILGIIMALVGLCFLFFFIRKLRQAYSSKK